MKEIAELEAGATLGTGDDDKQIAVSVIVPVNERPESLPELYEEYAAPLKRADFPFEFLFVVEPWHRRLAERLSELMSRGAPIRVLEVGQGVGEATLLKLAAEQSHGRIIATLPAYRRVQADALLELIDRVERGVDVAVARRWPRRDSWINRLQTRVFHALLGGLGGGQIHDVACGVRAMRREVLEKIPLYGDFFRFLPLLALREGYRVEEVDSPQHEADVRSRIYSPGVYLRRLIDVLGLFFLLRFTEKPLRFFGLLGSLFSFAGGAVLAVLLVQRLGGQGIADRPLLLLGVLLLVLGVQAIALGLIGEIIVHLHAPRKRPYRLSNQSDRHSPSSASLSE